MSQVQETLIPLLGVVTDVRVDTPDVKTFRVNALDGGKVFEHIPGQCAMLSIPGVGEAMFSITSSPTNTEYMEFSIKKCGCVTDWLHQAEPGQQITIRGPYGNPFPVDDVFAGMGTTRDAYVKAVMSSMQFDAMISELAKALELSGNYYIDGEVLVVTYEDDTFEKMKYNFGKEDLTITISDGTNEFAIYCQKTE